MQVTDAMVAAAIEAWRRDWLTGPPEQNETSSMRAVLEAALAEMWQSMDSAPKDGERVLLGFRGSMSAEGYWHDGSRNHWNCSGWYFADDDVLTGRPCDPDCYMQLPTPPPPRGK